MSKFLVRSLFILFVSCSKEDIEIKHEPPIFESSIPINGATDVNVETLIEVVLDEVVTLEEAHNITLNENAANVKALLTKLVFTQILQENTTYTISIPKGAIVNTFGVALQQEIQISFSTEEKIEINIAASLVTANPSSQAVNVYNFLKENYGTKIISASVANTAWNINEAEWVYHHTGKYPAIATMDYMFLPWSPANWINYNEIDFLKDWWNNNGIISACWHWNVPPNSSITNPSDYSFRTSKTINGIDVKVDFKASNVPIEGTWENTIAKADFDKLISYMKLLQDENIPIIWRPLHEAAGNIYESNNGKAWFWWGVDGGEAYVALWRYMFDYFKEKGINNLIWVWTTQTKDHAFYPGDEYVDIVGKDIYNNSDEPDIATQFDLIQETYPTKMISLSECGSVANIPKQWDKGAKWSWFMPWTDHERTNDINEADFTETEHEFANADWWKDAVNQDYVITRNKMPSLK